MKTKTAQHVMRALQQSAPQMQPRAPQPQRWQTRRVNEATRAALAAHGAVRKDEGEHGGGSV